MSNLRIENLITLDDSGLPKAPSVSQIIDKDILSLYTKDISKDKRMYLKWAGVIYYLADPKSPARQQGLSDKETIKEAIEQFDLPKNFIPDKLMWEIIRKYKSRAVGIAGETLENLYKSMNTVNKLINISHEVLNGELENGVNMENMGTVITHIDNIIKKAKEIPDVMKAISKAKEALHDEEELGISRGGGAVLSSMNADEGI